MRNHSTWEYCSLPPRRQLPGWNASPSQGYPQQYVAGTYLYTWMQRDNMEQSFSCLRKQAAITTPQLKPGKSDKAKSDAQNTGNHVFTNRKKKNNYNRKYNCVGLSVTTRLNFFFAVPTPLEL